MFEKRKEGRKAYIATNSHEEEELDELKWQIGGVGSKLERWREFSWKGKGNFTNNQRQTFFITNQFLKILLGMTKYKSILLPLSIQFYST